MTRRILFVDDDADIQTAARILLTRRGFEAIGARTPQEALSALACEAIDAVLLDLNYAPGATTGAEGLSLLRELLAADPSLPVVVVTGHSGVAIAVSAMRAGAIDFVMKPWNNERLIAVLNAALSGDTRPIRPASAPRADMAANTGADGRGPEPVMIGASAAMAHAFATAARIAPTVVNVLLTGKAGTGKNALARRIHRLSGRPIALTALDAAALDGAALEAADQTILLRDVDGLAPAMQRRIVDRLDAPQPPRLIATSRLDPQELQTLLTPTLYFRLATIRISLPPLAGRGDDLADLARHFLRFYAHRHARPVPEFDEDMRLRLTARPWPQNLHEFQTVMERWVLLGAAAALDEASASDADIASATLAQSERAMIEQALKRHGFNVSHAARDLGLTRPALYRRMARYGF